MNQTITSQLTPPTSNSNGSFVYTSSNTDVATITNNAGVYSINVISAGTSIITAIQEESGTYGSTSVSSTLVILLSPTLGTFSLPTGVSLYINQTITRQLTPPTSNSNGSFVYTSSNTDVATITNNAGVYSINVISFGTIVITATQEASGIYASKSVSSTLVILTPPTINFPNFSMLYTTRYLARSYSEGIASIATPIEISSNSSGSFSFTRDTRPGVYITIDNQLRTVNIPTTSPQTYGTYYIPITATQQAYGNYTSGTATAQIIYYIL
jgi:hypothetical protein